MTSETGQPDVQPGAMMHLTHDARGTVRAVPDAERTYSGEALAGGPDTAPATPSTDRRGQRDGWRLYRHTEAEPGEAPALERLDRALWFGDELAGDLDACAKAYAALCRWVAETFRGCHLKLTPGATAFSLIEHTVPWGKGQPRPYEYPTLEDASARRIAANTPPHRQEYTALDGLLMRRFAVYDTRVSYLAFMRHLPMIPAEGIIHDTGAYEPYREGKYRALVTVPQGWQHIGLAPRKRPAGDGWEWPATPGEEWECWLDTQEVRLLLDKGWPVDVRERVLFAGPKTPGADPLREYVERLTAEIERLEPYRGRNAATDAYRAALRALAVKTVALWQKSSNTRAGDIADAGELAEWAEGAGVELDTVVPLPNDDGSGYHVEGYAKLSEFQQHWRRIEWASAILARERVTMTRRALSLPRGAVLSIDGDGMHLADVAPDALAGWADTGKVGAFRAKLETTFPRDRRVPGDLGGLRELAAICSTRTASAKGKKGAKGA